VSRPLRYYRARSEAAEVVRDHLAREEEYNATIAALVQQLGADTTYCLRSPHGAVTALSFPGEPPRGWIGTEYPGYYQPSPLEQCAHRVTLKGSWKHGGPWGDLGFALMGVSGYLGHADNDRPVRAVVRVHLLGDEIVIATPDYDFVPALRGCDRIDIREGRYRYLIKVAGEPAEKEHSDG
jgi:hypothetical protein